VLDNRNAVRCASAQAHRLLRELPLLTHPRTHALQLGALAFCPHYFSAITQLVVERQDFGDSLKKPLHINCFGATLTGLAVNAANLQQFVVRLIEGFGRNQDRIR